MRVLFISRGFRTLAVEYLAAVLKKNRHEAVAVNNPAYFSGSSEEVAKNVRRLRPDMVALSVDSINSAWYFTIAQKIKARSSIPIVVGGPHVTLNAEDVIERSYIDYVVMGEGEFALLDLADALDKGHAVSSIANVWSRQDGCIIRNPVRPPIHDLDALPFPDKDVYVGDYFFDKQIPSPQYTYYIVTSRGCPFKCSYCHYDFLNELYGNKEGRAVRYRSISNVMAELKAAVTRYPIKSVAFWDDNFTINKQRLLELIDVYRREINLPFYCPTHPSLVNEEVAEALSRVKGVRVALGLQTINPDVRKNVLHRYESNDAARKAIDLFEQKGIHYTVDIMTGLPDEKIEDYTGLLDFFSRISSIKSLRIFTLIYFAGVTITKNARERGLINDDDWRVLKQMGYVVAHPHAMIERIRNFLLISFAFPESVNRWIVRHQVYRFFRGSREFYEKIRNNLPRTLPDRSRKAAESGQDRAEARLFSARLRLLIGSIFGRFKRSSYYARLRPLPELAPPNGVTGSAY